MRRRRSACRRKFDAGFRAHNTNVYPDRPDRCYLGYIDGGIMVLDISERSRPKLVSRWTNSPPYNGFNHTVLPLFERGLLVVSDESVQDNAADWPKLVWIVDARDERHLVSICHAARAAGGRFPAAAGASARTTCTRTRRCPAHGSRRTSSSAPSSTRGVRAYDISDPYSPREIAYFVPPAPEGSKIGAVQINDVFVDDRGIVFTVDRHNGGLYALEMNV